MRKSKVKGLLLIGIGALIYRYVKHQQDVNKKNISMMDKYQRYYKTFYRWLVLKNDNSSIEKFFLKNNIKSVAVYGMGEFAYAFIKEMEHSGVSLKYGIDQNAGAIQMDIPVVTMEEIEEDVDAIIVTVIDRFDSIKENLQKYTDLQIISLEQVIFQA